MPSEIAEITLRTDKVLLGETAEARRDEFFAQLVERARAGDESAFEQIMVLSQHRVVRTAWRILGDAEDARDAAQEVFFRVFKYLHRFKLEEDFNAWLYRITVNVCRDAARKGSKLKNVTSFEVERERGNLASLASPHDTEETTVLGQRRAIIARALETLSEKERAAIVLRDLEGLSTEEVASIMGTRPATIRSQISSARQKIKLYCDRAIQKGRSER